VYHVVVTVSTPFRCGGLIANVVGTPGDDELRSSTFQVTPHPNIPAVQGRIVFHGRGGDDTIVADTARQTIQCGGGGADMLKGGSKVDRLYGQAGPDSLAGRAGSPDRCDGGPGSDTRDKGCEQVRSIP
jgi:Ca2+-binding RTX toxin-like protein